MGDGSVTLVGLNQPASVHDGLVGHCRRKLTPPRIDFIESELNTTGLTL